MNQPGSRGAARDASTARRVRESACTGGPFVNVGIVQEELPAAIQLMQRVLASSATVSRKSFRRLADQRFRDLRARLATIWTDAPSIRAIGVGRLNLQRADSHALKPAGGLACIGKRATPGGSSDQHLGKVPVPVPLATMETSKTSSVTRRRHSARCFRPDNDLMNRGASPFHR